MHDSETPSFVPGYCQYFKCRVMNSDCYLYSDILYPCKLVFSHSQKQQESGKESEFTFPIQARRLDKQSLTKAARCRM